jgi:hypothetical protein
MLCQQVKIGKNEERFRSCRRWAPPHLSGLGDNDEKVSDHCRRRVAPGDCGHRAADHRDDWRWRRSDPDRARVSDKDQDVCYRKKIRPVTTQERIVVGAKVPASVELEAVPADWGPSVTKYRYVYSNNRVMLVDPGTRTVVHEID